MPLAVELCSDAVAAVREAAADHAGRLLASRHHRQQERARLLTGPLSALRGAASFTQRQTFVRICCHLLATDARQPWQQEFLSPLVGLATDPVPNVRLALARVLAGARPEVLAGLDDAESAVHLLSADADRDVHEMMNSHPRHHKHHLPNTPAGSCLEHH